MSCRIAIAAAPTASESVASNQGLLDHMGMGWISVVTVMSKVERTIERKHGGARRIWE